MKVWPVKYPKVTELLILSATGALALVCFRLGIVFVGAGLSTLAFSFWKILARPEAPEPSPKPPAGRQLPK
jgi:hypothetical protein